MEFKAYQQRIREQVIMKDAWDREALTAVTARHGQGAFETLRHIISETKRLHENLKSEADDVRRDLADLDRSFAENRFYSKTPLYRTTVNETYAAFHAMLHTAIRVCDSFDVFVPSFYDAWSLEQRATLLSYAVEERFAVDHHAVVLKNGEKVSEHQTEWQAWDAVKKAVRS